MITDNFLMEIDNETFICCEFNMGIYEQIYNWLKNQIGENKPYKSQNAFAEAYGVDKMRINRIFNDSKVQRYKDFANFLDALGIKILFPDQSVDTQKSVHFVKPEVISAEDLGEGPIDENYMAVPKSKRKVAAGRGIIPDDKVDSWILVWKGQEAVRHKSNLAVVEIDNREGTSMEPTLHPGDLALVDRNDWEPKHPPGNIYLIQTPEGDEMGMTIKRVKKQMKNGREFIIFYPDNPNHEPEMYDMATDYDNMLSRAIIGRVIWSWSDMTKK